MCCQKRRFCFLNSKERETETPGSAALADLASGAFGAVFPIVREDFNVIPTELAGTVPQVLVSDLFTR